MHERSASGPSAASRAPAGTVCPPQQEYRTDIETLRRVAAGLRAPGVRPARPSPDDVDLSRREFGRVLSRLRAIGYEELRGAR
ncbi:hypothetical protein [Nocardia sp. NPDC003345]